MRLGKLLSVGEVVEDEAAGAGAPAEVPAAETVRAQAAGPAPAAR
jgi:hypothetical protein